MKKTLLMIRIFTTWWTKGYWIIISSTSTALHFNFTSLGLTLRTRWPFIEPVSKASDMRKMITGKNSDIYSWIHADYTRTLVWRFLNLCLLDLTKNRATLSLRTISENGLDWNVWNMCWFKCHGINLLLCFISIWIERVSIFKRISKNFFPPINTNTKADNYKSK